MKKLLPIIGCLLLLSACGKGKPTVTIDDEILDTETYSVITPTGGKIVDEKHGEETWFAYGAMQGIGGVPANGFAKSHRFDDRAFLHTIQLNINPASDGFFYEGWLVDKDGNTISSGHMRSLFGDARHALRFEADRDLRDYLKVLVTLEPDDGDPSPAEHVAAGTLRVTER